MMSGSDRAEAARQSDHSPSTDPPDPLAMRQRIEAAIGQILLALSVLPRYRHLPLSEIDALVVQPLMRDRIAVAVMPADGAAPGSSPGSTTGGHGGPIAGIAIWASVSEAVDARIREQIAAGVFPIRLRPEDWKSGPINWLFDVIAPDPKRVASVLANFRRIAGEGTLRLHPVVARMVPAETLEQLGATRMTPDGAAAPAPAGAAASSEAAGNGTAGNGSGAGDA